jgi:cytochrome c oxidase cbb3-type subunit I/II
MAYNLYKTAKAGSLIENVEVSAPPLQVYKPHKGEHWHRWIERRPIQLLIGSTIVVLIGGLIEIFPMIVIDKNVPKIISVQPYTPLEIEGRDIYIREGCVGCHSQMIRPLRSETERYGEFSKSGEFIYDRPHLWGSKRTGPDLHRVGGKYSHSWHYNHMEDPELMSPGSIMPPYPWLLDQELNTDYTIAKMKVLKMLNTPYAKNYEETAIEQLEKQARSIANELKAQGVEHEDLEKAEIVALIAYLQRLGTDADPQKQVNK